MNYEYHLVSEKGSDRATSYPHANKAITFGNKTHIVWTDTVAITQVRTFDHSIGQWSPTVTVGHGCDNHNDPCLAVGADQRLRLAYGPHGPYDQIHQTCVWPTGAFHYCVAPNPNSWEGIDKANHSFFGYQGTYSSLACTKSGVDCIAYRGGEHPPAVMFQRQTPHGGWSNATPLLHQVIEPEYTFYNAQLISLPDGRLYLGANFYAMPRGHSLGVAVIMSKDSGKTWQNVRGKQMALPAEYSKAIAVPHGSPTYDPRICGLAFDSAKRPLVLTVNNSTLEHKALLSIFTGRTWRTIDLAPLLPTPWGVSHGSLTVDTQNRVHVALSAIDKNKVSTAPDRHRKEMFGHPSTEIFHLCSSDDCRTFSCAMVSKPDPAVANWQAILSLQGAHHSVAIPVLMYTHGNTQQNAPGIDCRHTVLTDVYCVFIRD